MTTPRVASLIVAMATVAFVGVTSQLGAADAPKAATYSYEGVKNCKMCHKKPATGDQYTLWLGTAHAKAYTSLASEKSVAKAKELGLGDPQKEPKCLECHVTAFPVMADLTGHGVTVDEGVSCESCHGAGSGYQKKVTMQGVTEGKIDAASVGLLTPTKETCEKCHNPRNPFHKPFNFEEAAKKIAHPIPKAAETKAG